MKLATTALRAALLAALLSPATASAQQRDGAIQPVAYNRYYQPSPNEEFDDKATEKAEESTIGSNNLAPAGSGGGDDGGPATCYSEKFEPVRLFGRTPFEKKWGIVATGWLAQSYTQNFSSPRDRTNGPVTWTDRSNDYQMNELYMILKRDVDNGGEGWDWGFRWDTLYGTSARWDVSAGFEDKFNANITQSQYNIAMPNAAVIAQYNDLKVTMGRFISPVGFYTVGTYNNFFNTIPYTYQYGEPFTHTGFLAQYQVSDDWNLGAGLTRGWDNTGSFNPSAGYIGTVVRNNLFKEGDSVAWVPVFSNEPVAYADNGLPISAGVAGVPNNSPAFAPRYFQTFVYSRPLTSKLTYVYQSDFGFQANAWADGSAAHWYGVNQYLYYKVNNCISWGINAEWFRDDTGFRVGGFLPNYYQAYYGSQIRGLATTRSDYIGNFYQVTMGPRWTPNPNLVVRPNLRFDWFDGTQGPNNPGFAGGGGSPYGDGTKNWQGILGTDIVIVY